MTEKSYVPSDIIQQGQPYRIDTKPFEKLMYKKTDIAAELAHRDIEIERLQARLADAEKVIRLCIFPLRHPIDDWKGIHEANALSAISAFLSLANND